jgi:hypothetical protein
MALSNEEVIDPGFATWSSLPGLQMFGKSDDIGDMDEEDSDDDDDEDDDGDEDADKGGKEDEDDDDDLDDLSEEELRANLRKTRSSLKKANGQSKNHRIARRRAEKDKAALEAEIAKRGKGKPKDDDDEDDEDKVEKARAEERAKSDERLILAKAETKLLAAGLTPGKEARAIKLLEIGNVTVGDDGKLEGLDDEIADLKDEFPELFKKIRKGGNVNGQDGKDGKGRPKPKSSADKLAARLKR